MPKINDIDNMTQAMRDGALRLVIANYVENGESFSKYDVTSGVRSLLAMIADFTHADVRELIGEEILNMVKSGLQYGDSIVDGPTGEYVLYAPSTPLATEDDSEDVEEEVTLDKYDKLWIELIEKAIESDIKVVKYNTNTYKIDFDSGVFILIMINGGNQTFNRATVHTASGEETGSFKTLKDMCDNINEFMQPDVQKIVNSFNPQSSMADADVAVPVTPKASRVYISKLYCDDAGFVAGTKLKISTKNQRVVAITKAKDDDYNYTVNSDGRIRFHRKYLDEIGLSESSMKITTYAGIIMLSNVA